MTLLPDSPYIVLSAGEDGQVPIFKKSSRQKLKSSSRCCQLISGSPSLTRYYFWGMKKTKRFAPTHSHLVQDVVLRNSHQVPIYSIHSSPTNSHLFCTSGRWPSFVLLSITTSETFLTGTSSSGCLIGDIWVWKQEGVVRYFDIKVTICSRFHLLHISSFSRYRFIGTAPQT